MKTLGFIVRFLFTMVGIAACSALATFFVAIFNLQGVQNAVEFFKHLIGG